MEKTLDQVIEKFRLPVPDTEVNELSEKDQDMLLRKAFDSSREFGLNFLTENNKNNLTLSELKELLISLDIPCLDGEWSQRDGAYFVNRKECTCQASRFSCLYWRESIDGLVMGAGDEERYSRHKSIVYGNDEECVDVFYNISSGNFRWGEVPHEIVSLLKPVLDKYMQKKVTVTLMGYAENTLYYKIKDNNSDLAPFRHKFITENISRISKKRFPLLTLVEMSPRAVIEGDF